MAQFRAVSNIAPEMGRIFLFIGIVSCTPLVVAALYREFGLLAPMASAPVLFIITGLILGKIPTSNKEPTLGVSLASVALIWLACSFIGGLPFFFGIGMPYTDSVFEAMSGWTSTGLTLMTSVDQAPHTILFWRSLTQWMGGIGIVAFTVALINRSSMTHFRLYRSEGRSEAFMPNVVDTASQMWKIYIILTVAGIGLVLFSGIELWDAINISMTAI
ncbi:MAG: potassium transporter TrkG, partial [Candidatus Omnitrophica bacterium]|nr:potassium transporter TrkG [Candidatus Omnitrophota bacterium]